MRIRKNLENTLTRKFVGVTKDYQDQQTKYKADIKRKVARQLQNVKPDVTEEEIDSIMSSGPQNVENVYRAAILQDAADPIKSVQRREAISTRAFSSLSGPSRSSTRCSSISRC